MKPWLSLDKFCLLNLMCNGLASPNFAAGCRGGQSVRVCVSIAQYVRWRCAVGAVLFAVIQDFCFGCRIVPAKFGGHPQRGAGGHVGVVMTIMAPACAADHQILEASDPFVAAVM